MDVQCGMCGDTISVRYEASESEEMPSGIICKACQDYTMGYIYPEPVVAKREVNCSCGMPDCESSKGAWR